MKTIARISSALFVALFLLAPGAPARTPSVSTVNVTPKRGRLRVAAAGEVSDLRVEVTDEVGETVFEGGQAAGRPLDWDMRDEAGRKVRPGEYTVLVSYRTPAGKLRRRVEQVLVTEEPTGDAEKADGQKSTASSAPNLEPLVDGTGAASRVPKFQDGNTLASSSIMDVGGNISIGKLAAPAAGLRLEVSGAVRLAPGGTGGFMQFGSPNGETGLTWQKGTTSRADIRFNGSTLKLAAVAGTAVPPDTNGIVVTTGGRVGVGTLAPAAKLHSPGAGVPAVYGESNNRGVWGKSTGASYGVYGESASGIGVQGTSTSNFGVTGHRGPCAAQRRASTATRLTPPASG